MKFQKLFLTALIVFALMFLAERQSQAQLAPDDYQLTSEGYDTDTTATTTANDTSDYHWTITKPILKESEYDIVVEVKQNSQLQYAVIDYPGVSSFRVRYHEPDSTGFVQGYTKFGWMDLGLYKPGTTAAEGDASFQFTLQTGSAIWAFRLQRKY